MPRGLGRGTEGPNNDIFVGSFVMYSVLLTEGNILYHSLLYRLYALLIIDVLLCTHNTVTASISSGVLHVVAYSFISLFQVD